MRFLIILAFLYGSVSMAAVKDFNGLVYEATQQEKRLHRKLLQAIQNTQVAIAANDRKEQYQIQGPLDNDFKVRLIRATP